VQKKTALAQTLKSTQSKPAKRFGARTHWKESGFIFNEMVRHCYCLRSFSFFAMLNQWRGRIV
jgi:hypothetical protein